VKLIKQYGLMRSGTNFAEIVFTKNYAVKFLDHKTTGSKHARPVWKKLKPRPDFVLVCVKEPFAWLDSIFRRLVHIRKQEPGNFRPWLAASLKRPVKAVDTKRTPVDVWNEFHRHWLSCTIVPVHVLRNEDTLRHKKAKKVFDRLAKDMGLDRLGAESAWEAPSFYVRASTEVRTKPFRPGYYRNRKYLERFGEELIAGVEARLDKSVLRRLGYEPTGK